jgi:hypothetical protein
VQVRTGPTDGVNTEISGKDVTEGMEVVVGEMQAGSKGGGAGASGSTNPFAPSFPRGGGRGR